MFGFGDSLERRQRFELETLFRGSMLAMGLVKNNLSLVERGLSRGEDPNTRYSYEEDNHLIAMPNPVTTITPIVQAAIIESLPIAELLVAHGADVNLCQRNGESALANAANRGNVELVAFFLEHGADPNLTKSYGTALSMANGVAVMKMLLEYGADPNIPDSDGDLPIIGSIDTRNLDEIELLINYGTDMTRPNRQGETPIDRAKRKGIYDAVIELIRDAEAPSERDESEQPSRDDDRIDRKDRPGTILFSVQPDAQDASNGPDARLINCVERCIYANAKYLGVIALVVRTRQSEGRPNFIGFLSHTLKLLSGSLYRLQTTDAGRSGEWIVPEEYSEFYGIESHFDWSTYISDCGNVAYAQELGRQGRELPRQNNGLPWLPINWPSQLSALETTSHMAIAQCLALLNVAQEQGDAFIKSILLNGSSYLFDLVLSFFTMQMSVFHMAYQNSVMFIPSDVLEKPMGFSLQLFGTDVNPDAPIAVIPQQLVSLRYIPNEDGMVAVGRQVLAGQQGIFLRTDRTAVPYLEIIARNFVEGLKRQVE